jgi:hypothetical protein
MSKTVGEFNREGRVQDETIDIAVDAREARGRARGLCFGKLGDAQKMPPIADRAGTEGDGARSSAPRATIRAPTDQVRMGSVRIRFLLAA